MVLVQISVIIIAATFLAYVAKLLKQPLIPAYIIAGLVIGPLGLKLITSSEVIHSLAELGIAFLLFIVGLELSFRRLKETGKPAALIGIAQVLIVLTLGFIVAVLLGFNQMESFYIGLILTFSSTMVVIKLLSDKSELDTLHGRLTLGILLVQDIFVIIAMTILMNLNSLSFQILAPSLAMGIGLLAIAIICSRFVLPTLFRYIADSQELLFLSALSWLFVFAAISYYGGFSVAIGAFIAGVGLATFPYNIEIVSRMKSLKDFFITIFFVTLGMQLMPLNLSQLLIPIIILVGVVVLIKPLIIMLLTSAANYMRRTSFLTSISLGQISEFSLILAAQGLLLGHITSELFSMTIIMAIITIGLTSYLIKFDNQAYSIFSGSLTVFERAVREKKELEHIPKKLENHIVVCGCHRMGSRIVEILRKLGKADFLVIDFDPEVIKKLAEQGIHCLYGDIGDIEILNRAKLRKASMVISTIPSQEDNMLLIDYVKGRGKEIPVFVVAPYAYQAVELYEKGADYVIIPRMLCGERMADIIEKLTHKTIKIGKIKKNHMAKLEEMEEERVLGKYASKVVKTIKKK